MICHQPAQEKIVTELLKDSLGFKGLVITDAMNMGGVVNVEKCGLKAAQAGCDQLLMPVDEEEVLFSILEKWGMMKLSNNKYMLQ